MTAVDCGQDAALTRDEIELEAHIKSCGELVEQAMANYETSGNFADRGEADRWRIEMERAIALRAPETVAKLEAARGLA